MTPWSPPGYDVKIIGGRKVIIWDEPKKEKKKPVFVPAIISKSPSKEREKESNHGENPDEILPAPPLLPPHSTGNAAPSGWDPLPSPPQEEDNDEDSRVAFPIIERMEGEARLSRRSSDSDSLNSSYKVLPPIKRPEHETQSESESDFGREEDLRDFCTTRMRFISERGLGMVLTELRKIDRDRERALPPETVSRVLETPKYRLGISPALSKLLAKFPNPQIAGYVNYELLLDWLEQRRLEARPTKENVVVDQRLPFSSPPAKQSRGSQPTKREPKKAMTGEQELAVLELARTLGRQKVELERLGQVMRSKDHYGNDQLSGQQVSASLRAVGLTVERSAFASWLRSADTIGKGIYSIPGLLEVMSQAVKRAKGEEGRPARDKRIPEVHERRDKALVAAPLTNANTKEEDLSWQQLLDLNSSLPRVRGRGEDGGLRLRNLARLRSAMEQSYKQQHGYLPPKDVVQLALAYSTVYQLGLDQGIITAAVNYSRSLDLRRGLVNIEKFVAYLNRELQN